MKSALRKSLSVLLTLTMALSLFGGLTLTAGAANTYQISSYAGLSAFADAVNGGETDACAILTADVTAEGTDWTPIGDLDHPYVGTFDGDGHTITGLSTESSADREYVGLFGYVDAGGVVQNVGLVGGCIKGKDFVGAVAGRNYGKIINCYTTGEVTATDNSAFVGGVVGYNDEGTVRSCYNTGTVSGLNACAGGVVGYNTEGTVQNCYNTGDVNGAIVGGVAGYNAADNVGSAEISNCFNIGKVSGTNMVGGVAGFNYATTDLGSVNTATVTNCYNMGAVSVTNGSEVGGVVGRNQQEFGCPAEVTNCYSAGTVTANGFGIDAGGVIGRNYNGAVQNCYYDSDVCAANNGVGTKLTTAQMTGMDALSNMPGFDANTWLQKANTETADIFTRFYPHLKGFAYDVTCAVADWYARREESNIMEISDYAGLKAFAAAVNGGRIKLTGVLKSDILATDKEWTPIGNESKPYVGIFDGGGHTITGLSNQEAAATPDSAGLFGYLGENAVVKNVRLTSVDLKATYYLGAVAGNAKGAEITNCRNTGEISCAAFHVGGIIGIIRGAIVSNCCNTGDITSTANNAYVGGIAGYLSGDQSAAGITNCYNTGTVTGKGKYSNVGGIAGYANDTGGTVEIANCYNTGAVTATGTYSRAGGIAASSCVFSGGTVEVINCYNAGAVTADERVGGVVGLKYDSVVRNCWYDDNVCNLSSAVGSVADPDDVMGLHMCEMTGADALTQMPFSESSAWLVKENSDICVFYPHLKGFDLDADGDQMDASAIDPADWPAKRNHSHSYGAPVWGWEADHSKAAAAFTCSGCGDTQTVTDNAPVFTEVTPAECESDQTGYYTATVNFGGADYTEQTGTAAVANTAPGHSYGDAHWTWNADHTSARATITCAVCGSDIIKDADEIKENVITPADCVTDKVVTYTASVDLNGERYSVTTENITLPGTATGTHTFGTTGEAVYICTVCGRLQDNGACGQYYSAYIKHHSDVLSAIDNALPLFEQTLRDHGITGSSYIDAGTALRTKAIGDLGDALNYEAYIAFGKSCQWHKDRFYGILAQLNSGLNDLVNRGDFENYKAEQKVAAEAMAQDGDSAAAAQIIADAVAAIEALTYDEAKTLDENKAAVDALADIAGALETQRAADAAVAQLADAKADAKAELADYKNAADYRAAEQADLADAIAAGNAAIDAAADADAVAAALTEAKALLDAIKTDAQLTAEEAAAAQLAADKAAFDAYKADRKIAVQDLARAGDSEAAVQIIAAAAAAIEALTYDETKTLDENKAAVDAAADIADALAAQRAADETPATPGKTDECPVCGQVHNGGLFDVLQGELHWWLNVLRKIIRSFG